MNALWNSLSGREGRRASRLRERVPAGLEAALRDWIYGNLDRLPDDGDRLMRRLDLVVPRKLQEEYERDYAQYRLKLRAREERIRELQEAAAKRAAAAAAEQGESESKALVPVAASIGMRVPIPEAPNDPRHVYVAYWTPRAHLLDIIDALLAYLAYKPPIPPASDPVGALFRKARLAMRTKEREELQGLLDDGRMAYRVRADGHGLERRVDAVATAAALTAAELAEEKGYPLAAKRLAEAWDQIYSLNPDPSGAYRDAIRAVEAVACPLFLPSALSPTLGDVRAHLDQGRAKYEFAIADKQNKPASIHAVLEMISTLWFGHRDRHEGGSTSGTVGQEAAETAVSLAVCLVQLLSSNAVRRRDGRG